MLRPGWLPTPSYANRPDPPSQAVTDAPDSQLQMTKRPKMDTQTIARKIARESLHEDRLGTFDRDIAGPPSIQIRIPLLDPVALKNHLQMLAVTVSDCLVLCDQTKRGDRGILIDVRGRLRLVNQRVNAYRRIRTV